MTEMEDALRTCMEQLLLVREEKEHLIIEAASKISSEQKKVRDLQHKLDDANKRIAKFATENYNLCKTVETKDRLISELNESKAMSDDKLVDAISKLELTQKHSASLQYEVRMLQKELEIRNKEREYDLKSADAAHKKQKENIKTIAILEAECHRLRTMVQKRLPGPAALAKMRDEVEHTGTRPVESRMRRSSTPRGSASESYSVKLRALDDENKHLRQLLAKKDGELQCVQMKYADEACRLSVVQMQLDELSGGLDLDDNSCSESWASALVSELENFKAGKQRASRRSVAGSDVNLLDDHVEIERLEMASRPSSAPHHNVPDAHDTDSKTIVSERVCRDLIPDAGLYDNDPGWLQDVLKLIRHKHQISGKSVDAILKEVIRALRCDITAKGEDVPNVSYDRSELDKMVKNLVERVNCMIERSTENNVVSCRSILHQNSEFISHLENLVHVCGDVLYGTANLEKIIYEVCLILEWIMSQCFSPLDESNTVGNINRRNFHGNESLRTSNVPNKHRTRSAKSAVEAVIQPDGQKEPIETTEDQIHDHILVSQLQDQLAICKLDEELAALILDQRNNSCQERQSVYCETESPATHGSMEELAEQQDKQNSAISAAAEKLAECQETITNLSKQLQALSSPRNADISDTEKSENLLPSLAIILAGESSKHEDFSSPASGEDTCKKEHVEPDATQKNLSVQEQDAGTDLNADDNDSRQVTDQPTFSKSRQVAVSVDAKKKKRRASLLSGLIFGRKV